jgi:hypothetical protein
MPADLFTDLTALLRTLHKSVIGLYCAWNICQKGRKNNLTQIMQPSRRGISIRPSWRDQYLAAFAQLYDISALTFIHAGVDSLQ